MFYFISQKLYEIVVRHFLACVSQPAVGAETTVEIDIAGELFSASGRVILAVGFLPHSQFYVFCFEVKSYLIFIRGFLSCHITYLLVGRC